MNEVFDTVWATELTDDALELGAYRLLTRTGHIADDALNLMGEVLTAWHQSIIAIEQAHHTRRRRSRTPSYYVSPQD